MMLIKFLTQRHRDVNPSYTTAYITKREGVRAKLNVAVLSIIHSLNVVYNDCIN